MPADILLYALIAAGLIFWLKNILGTRNEDEKDNSQSYTDDREEKDDSFMASIQKPKKSSQGNVVSLDALVGRNSRTLPRHVRIDNKTAENEIEDLSERYKEFDLNHFVSGAESAFQIIIEAFADGDLDTLEDLLAPAVFTAFKAAIEDRNARNETVETEVKSVEKIDITHAIVKNDVFYITVRFTAREICVIRDKAGEIISGDPKRLTQMVDVWVFSHDTKAGGPEWYLHETRDDEIEDHKTPIPEAGKE